MVGFCGDMYGRRKVQVFGGMASIDLPARMTDISDFRPVPDHQEIYTDANSDQSVIIEILVRFCSLYAAELHGVPESLRVR
jgi:Ran-interacting Mog1 protein